MRNNVKIELDCPTCGTSFFIKTDIDWGTQKPVIFDCKECGKAVLTLGLHAPSDLNMHEDIETNCIFESF